MKGEHILAMKDYKSLKKIDKITDYFDLNDAKFLGKGAYGVVLMC